MVEVKIVTGRNAKMLEKELGKSFAIGFSLLGNMVVNSTDGLVQMVARNSEPLQPEDEKPKAKLEAVED